jgi:hypothetical protein
MRPSFTIDHPVKLIESQRSRRTVFGAATIVVAAAIGSCAVLHRTSSSPPATPVSLAIVPFTAPRHLAQAAESTFTLLVKRLEPLRNVHVVSHRTNDASYILRGSIEGEGDELAIAADIVDTANQRVFWSRTYRGNAIDLLALQTQLAFDAERFLRSYTNEQLTVQSKPTVRIMQAQLFCARRAEPSASAAARRTAQSTTIELVQGGRG